MESQMTCRVLIAMSSGITQGVACVLTHRSYVGMKTPQNMLSSSAPKGRGENFLRFFLFEVGAGDIVKPASSLHLSETCRDNIQVSKNKEQMKSHYRHFCNDSLMLRFKAREYVILNFGLKAARLRISRGAGTVTFRYWWVVIQTYPGPR
jgi:hypothetical protein